MINIGRLRNRIQILDYREDENELGQTIKGIVPIRTVWAEIHPLKSKEYIEAGLTQTETTYKITVRYFEGLTEEMVIGYKDSQFSIVSICDIEMKHLYYELMCKEIKKKRKKEDDRG
mgnify:FL=1